MLELDSSVCSRSGGRDPLVEEKVSLLHPPVFNLCSPFFPARDPSSLNPADPFCFFFSLFFSVKFHHSLFFSHLPAFLFLYDFFKVLHSDATLVILPRQLSLSLPLSPPFPCLYSSFYFIPFTTPSPPSPLTSVFEKNKIKFIDGSTSTLPQTRSKLQNYGIVQGAIKIYTEFRDPRRGGRVGEEGGERGWGGE